MPPEHVESMSTPSFSKAPSSSKDSALLEALRSERSRKLIQALPDHSAVFLLVVFVIVGALSSDVFLTPRNLLNIMWAVSVLGIVALGQTVLLVTRNFDMSVASVIGLVGIVTVLAQLAGFGLVGSIAVGLMTGAIFGVMNGLLVVTTGANPFLITLGTNALAYAAALSLTHSKTLYTTVPAFDNEIGRGKIFGVVNRSVVKFCRACTRARVCHVSDGVRTQSLRHRGSTQRSDGFRASAFAAFNSAPLFFAASQPRSLES